MLALLAVDRGRHPVARPATERLLSRRAVERLGFLPCCADGRRRLTLVATLLAVIALDRYPVAQAGNTAALLRDGQWSAVLGDRAVDGLALLRSGRPSVWLRDPRSMIYGCPAGGECPVAGGVGAGGVLSLRYQIWPPCCPRMARRLGRPGRPGAWRAPPWFSVVVSNLVAVSVLPGYVTRVRDLRHKPQRRMGASDPPGTPMMLAYRRSPTGFCGNNGLCTRIGSDVVDENPHQPPLVLS